MQTIEEIRQNINKLETYKNIALIYKLQTANISHRDENIFLLPALLGEGRYTFKKLIQTCAFSLYWNIYSLSCPGILDEALLPDSFEHAIERYVNAILSIQPLDSKHPKPYDSRKPYNFLGFSFGATLVYACAKRISELGGEIGKILLLDGYPPALYQRLSKYEHTKYLKNLLNFLIPVLNNQYYNENISKIVLNKNYHQLSRPQQVERAFEELLNKINNQKAKCMLLVAKRHLQFLETHSLCQHKLPFGAFFYLSSRNQEYSQIINCIENLSCYSSDYNFYFWNHYWEKITLSGFELTVDHLGILKPVIGTNPFKSGRWLRLGDQDFIEQPIIGPSYFYSVSGNKVFLFCIPVYLVESFELYLKEQIQTNIIYFDKEVTFTYNIQDKLYCALCNLFYDFSALSIDTGEILLNQFIQILQNLKLQSVASQISHPDIIEFKKYRKYGTVNLEINTDDNSKCFSYTFKYYIAANQYDIMQKLYDELDLIPQHDTDTNLLYRIELNQNKIKNFLTNFMLVISKYSKFENNVSRHPYTIFGCNPYSSILNDKPFAISEEKMQDEKLIKRLAFSRIKNTIDIDKYQERRNEALIKYHSR